MQTINILGVEVQVADSDAQKLKSELSNRGMIYSPTEWHYSHSKGQWVKISEMATEHLTNAFIVEYKNAVQNLFNDHKNRSITLHEMLTNLSSLAPSHFEHSNALFRELVKRDSASTSFSTLRYRP